MSSKEWVPHADLVEHDEEIVGRGAIEAWNVGASERMSSITKLHDHGD